MPLPKTNLQLAHSTLRELLHYDSRTGHFTWRVNRGRTAVAGSRAGTTRKDGTVVIGIKGKLYLANRLAWFYVYNEWPKGRLRTYNNDPSDLRIRNIVREAETLSPGRRAAYQRYRYHLTKAIDNGTPTNEVPVPKVLFTDRRRRKPVGQTDAAELDARLDAESARIRANYRKPE